LVLILLIPGKGLRCFCFRSPRNAFYVAIGHSSFNISWMKVFDELQFHCHHFWRWGTRLGCVVGDILHPVGRAAFASISSYYVASFIPAFCYGVRVSSLPLSLYLFRDWGSLCVRVRAEVAFVAWGTFSDAPELKGAGLEAMRNETLSKDNDDK
jgi:hypothetical protein